MLPRTLGLGGGIVLAVGSIAGSGILFLPSTIYVIAGSDSLVVWVVAALICVPLLGVFAALVRAVPDGAGLEGFVALGLDRRVSAPCRRCCSSSSIPPWRPRCSSRAAT